MKRSELALLLGKYFEVYVGTRVNDNLISAYYEFFGNEDKNVFETALKKLVSEANRKFAPTPGEVTQQLKLLKPQKIKNAVAKRESYREYLKRQGEKGLVYCFSITRQGKPIYWWLPKELAEQRGYVRRGEFNLGEVVIPRYELER